MSVFEIENGDPCLQSLLSSKDFKPLLDNYNCDDADNYDNGDNDRAPIGFFWVQFESL